MGKKNLEIYNVTEREQKVKTQRFFKGWTVNRKLNRKPQKTGVTFKNKNTKELQ